MSKPKSNKECILIIKHYPYDEQQSMIRYANWLEEAFTQNNWKTLSIRPEPIFGKLKPASNGLGKWLGYIDKYLFFPFILKREIRKIQDEMTKLIICIPDHSHGMYIPKIKDFPQLLHCHDLIAIRSAKGEFPKNKTSLSGKLYQKLISKGLKESKKIICISEATSKDFRRLFPSKKPKIDIAYNGLNFPYHPIEKTELNEEVQKLFKTHQIENKKFILHVGGNQWYKNRAGVIKIFEAFSSLYKTNEYQLIMIGKKPSKTLLELKEKTASKENIHFLENIDNTDLNCFYNAAQCLLFPSLLEGFGWPIIEAQSTGTPVITSNMPPMTEIILDKDYLIPPMPEKEELHRGWSEESAKYLHDLLEKIKLSHSFLYEESILNAQRFSSKKSIKKILQIYQENFDQI